MRGPMVGVALIVVLISPAKGAQATVEERQSISHSISDCIRDRSERCAAFKTTSVKIGVTVESSEADWLALADWKSSDGKKAGQVFLSTKGCGIWDVDVVSFGRPLTSKEIYAFLTRWPVVSPPQRAKRVTLELTSELARIDARSVAYLRVPPGPSC